MSQTSSSKDGEGGEDWFGNEDVRRSGAVRAQIFVTVKWIVLSENSTWVQDWGRTLRQPLGWAMHQLSVDDWICVGAAPASGWVARTSYQEERVTCSTATASCQNGGDAGRVLGVHEDCCAQEKHHCPRYPRETATKAVEPARIRVVGIYWETVG